MAYFNEVKLAGLVTSNVVLKYTSNGPLVKCTLSTDILVRLKGGKEFVATYNHTIVFDGQTAIDFSEQVAKGSFIATSGYLRYWYDKRTAETKAEIKCHWFEPIVFDNQPT